MCEGCASTRHTPNISARLIWALRASALERVQLDAGEQQVSGSDFKVVKRHHDGTDLVTIEFALLSLQISVATLDVPLTPELQRSRVMTGTARVNTDRIRRVIVV